MIDKDTARFLNYIKDNKNNNIDEIIELFPSMNHDQLYAFLYGISVREKNYIENNLLPIKTIGDFKNKQKIYNTFKEGFFEISQNGREALQEYDNQATSTESVNKEIKNAIVANWLSGSAIIISIISLLVSIFKKGS